MNIFIFPSGCCTLFSNQHNYSCDKNLESIKFAYDYTLCQLHKMRMVNSFMVENNTKTKSDECKVLELMSEPGIVSVVIISVCLEQCSKTLEHGKCATKHKQFPFEWTNYKRMNLHKIEDESWCCET